MRAALAALARREDLGHDAMHAVFGELMGGRCDPAQIGGLLLGLAAKGETWDEIAGAARAMRAAVVPVRPRRAPLLDTCGTGGSGVPRRNVSTAVALALAACGVAVAKHGNRGASSPSGSADVLEALGVDIRAPAARVAACIDRVGVGFLFAASLHPAMGHALPARRALGVRTLFNLLGPLTNPAGATQQLLGVYDPSRVEAMARALQSLGSERVAVVHGHRAGVAAGAGAPAGIDDLSPEGESLVALLEHGAVALHVLTPEQAGLPRVPLAALAGGSPQDNAHALERLLAGARDPATLPYRTAVAYAGALGLVVAGRGPLQALPELATVVLDALDSGAAQAVLARLRATSHDAALDDATVARGDAAPEGQAPPPPR